MQCWKCHTPLSEEIIKIGFRLTCDKCQSWLHCCKGCRHHKLGLPNQCEIPNTEQIADREGANFCEFFEPLMQPDQTPKQNLKSAAEKLFGQVNPDEESPKSQFDDLFG